MATTTYKILGQLAAAAAGAGATLYAVPNTVGKAAVVANIIVANRAAVDDTVRIWVMPLADIAGAPANKHAIAYDVPIPANDTMPFQLGITLAKGDGIKVYSLLGNCTFNATGLEYDN